MTNGALDEARTVRDLRICLKGFSVLKVNASTTILYEVNVVD